MTNLESPYVAPVCELSQPVLTVVPESIPDGSLNVDELGSRIVGMAGRLAAATCRWLLLVAQFDARDGAGRFCLPSTARWLTHYCGLSRRTAIEHVRVARALAGHPVLVEAMGAGRLSYSHVRAIARVTEFGDQRLVTDLVMVAEHGTVGQLEDLVRGLRTVEHNHSDSQDRSVESLSHRWRDDSRLGLSAVLDPEHGALVLEALEAMARREGISPAQALARMAAIVIHLDATRVPAEDAESVDSRDVANPQGGVEECSAEHTPAQPRLYGRIAGGPGLPHATVQRLLCSGRIRTVVQGEVGAVLDVGANRRLVSTKQFRALQIRDGGCCTVPGCGSTIGLEAHHVRQWIYGGKTVMANLVLLCRAHHHALHEDELKIVALGSQGFRFCRPDGNQLPHHVDPSEFAPTARNVEDEHDHVAADAATTRGDGTRLDRHYAVAVLAQGLSSTLRRSA